MSKKDAYYFSHDANAQDDPKCMQLIDVLGMEGYGIFWALVEKLRAEASYKLPLSITKSLSRRWATSQEKIDSVIKQFNLFVVENDEFFSLRLLRSMQEKSDKAKISANKRWEKTKELPVYDVEYIDAIASNGNAIACDRIETHVRIDANAMQPQCDGNAIAMRFDAIKGKEIEKEIEKKEKYIETIETIENSEKNTFNSIFDFFKFSDRVKSKMHDFSEMRKQHKKPLNENTMKLLCQQLTGLSKSENEQIEIIDASLINGWSGFYHLKTKEKPKQEEKKVDPYKGMKILNPRPGQGNYVE